MMSVRPALLGFLLAAPALAQTETPALSLGADPAAGPFLSDGGGARVQPSAPSDPDGGAAAEAARGAREGGLRRVYGDRLTVPPDYANDGRAVRAPGVSAEFELER
jgi:hypothetical protein